ncbi:MAG: hypothetical protein FWE94_03570 [Coriobacteriia bacterium]|nr:hypothetical protein [Coriobacteriia bacterium]
MGASGGGLGWKVFGLIVSIGLIIGGLSGQMVLRGTNSSAALVVFGLLWLVYDIYRLYKHFNPDPEVEVAADGTAASDGQATAAGQATALGIPQRSSLPLVAAGVMLLNVLCVLVPRFPAVFALVRGAVPANPLFLVQFLGVFPGIVFVVLVLAVLKKNIRLLIVPIVVKMVINIAIAFVPAFGVGARVNPSFLVGLFLEVALLAFIALTVAGKMPSKVPLLVASLVIGVLALLNYFAQWALPITRLGAPPSNLLVALVFNTLGIPCFYGAHALVAVALEKLSAHAADAEGARGAVGMPGGTGPRNGESAEVLT